MLDFCGPGLIVLLPLVAACFLAFRGMRLLEERLAKPLLTRLADSNRFRRAMFVSGGRLFIVGSGMDFGSRLLHTLGEVV